MILGNFDVENVLLILLGIIVLLIIWIVFIEIRIHRFLSGKDGKSLEKTIDAISRDNKEILKKQKEIEEYLVGIEERLRRSIQSVKTVRFDPFKGTGSGGKQSFATAFLNEEGEGMVLSSLFTRDRTSVFAKAVDKFKSEHELTGEESKVLTEAKGELKKKKGK